MDDEIVTLATFTDPFEAAQIKGRLEEEGIQVFQSGEQTNSLFPGIGGAFGRVQLHVAEKDLKRAMCILSRPDEDDEEVEENEDLPAGECSTAISDRAPSVRDREPESDAIQTGWREAGADVKPPDWQATEEEEDEDANEETAPRWTAEDYADRAWRAALIGLFVLPGILHVYSVALLFLLSEQPGELSVSGRRKGLGALVIDLLVLSAAALFVLGLFPGLR